MSAAVTQEQPPEHPVFLALKWVAGNLLVPGAAACIGVYATIQVMQADISAMKQALSESSAQMSAITERVVKLEGIAVENRARIMASASEIDSLRSTDMAIRDSLNQNMTVILRELSGVREALGELKGEVRRSK
jgi:hypothetical protein